MKTADITELFTPNEFALAIKLADAQTICDKIVTPKKLKHINKVTGQENDAKYMAYALYNATYNYQQ